MSDHIPFPCAQIDCQRQIEVMEIDIRLAHAQRDAAYVERNRVVAALAALAIRNGWRAGTRRTYGTDPEWYGCVYIDLPTGQVSWSFHDMEAATFRFLPPYEGGHDGHDTAEKYRRLAALVGS